MAKQALANGPKTTRELATYVMKAKGLDVGDKILAKAVAQRLIHPLRMQLAQGKLVTHGTRQAAFVWGSPASRYWPN